MSRTFAKYSFMKKLRKLFSVGIDAESNLRTIDSKLDEGSVSNALRRNLRQEEWTMIRTKRNLPDEFRKRFVTGARLKRLFAKRTLDDLKDAGLEAFGHLTMLEGKKRNRVFRWDDVFEAAKRVIERKSQEAEEKGKRMAAGHTSKQLQIVQAPKDAGAVVSEMEDARRKVAEARLQRAEH